MFDVNNKPTTVLTVFREFVQVFYEENLEEIEDNKWKTHIKLLIAGHNAQNSNCPSRLKEFFRLGLIQKEITQADLFVSSYTNRKQQELISPLGFILYYLGEASLPLVSLYLVLNEAHEQGDQRISLVKLLSVYSTKFNVFNQNYDDIKMFNDGLKYIIAAIASEIKVNADNIFNCPDMISIRSNGSKKFQDFNENDRHYILRSINNESSIQTLLDEDFTLNEVGQIRAGVIKQKAVTYYLGEDGYITKACEKFGIQLKALFDYVNIPNNDIAAIKLLNEHKLNDFINGLTCETTREKMAMLISEFRNLALQALDCIEANNAESVNEYNWQEILQGPPGTGKSYILKKRIIKSDHTERIVCHPEMTNAQFIGMYRPKQGGQDKQSDLTTQSEHHITYSFDPGPLTRILKKALEDYLSNENPNRHILIIEELNRANSAAMFADTFQLLDRTSKGWSEHSTHLGVDVHHELGEELIMKLQEKFKHDHDSLADADLKVAGIRFPPNLYIWATMNTADQGVFPMDTAFKRRWSFKYLGVNGDERISLKDQEWMKDKWNPYIYDDETPLRWQELRCAINEALDERDVEEDRQLGPFFLSEQELAASPEELIEHITNKVVGYLRDDVLRYEPHKLFKTVTSKGNLVRVPSFAKLRKQIKIKGILSVFEQNTLAPLISEESFQKVLDRFDQQRQESMPQIENSDEQKGLNEPVVMTDQIGEPEV